MKNIDKLLRFAQENQALPVVPMVDGEIPEDDCGYWIGEFGNVCIDEYLLVRKRVVFKSDDDVFDTLEECLSYEEFAKLPDSEEECRPIYDALPWIKAIIVYIDAKT